MKTTETELLEKAGLTYPVICAGAAETEIEPAPDALVPACVIPVAADDAIAWASGKLNDADILIKAPLVPEAVFIVNLPGRLAYRELLSRVKYWRARGAVFLIARTGTPVVDAHLLDNGCIRSLKENTEPPKWRFIAPPEAFARWMDKWSTPLANRLVAARQGPVL